MRGKMVRRRRERCPGFGSGTTRPCSKVVENSNRYMDEYAVHWKCFAWKLLSLYSSR